MSLRIAATLAALPIAATLAVGAAPPPAGIQVVIDNVRTTTGHVHVELCTRDDFTKDCTVEVDVPARPGATAIFRAVPPGTYAIQGYHDLNGNGKLDYNLFGVPKEPVFFSRLPKLPLRRPRFAESSFDHGTSDQRVTVTLSSYF